MAVGELAAELPVTRSAVSQHLKILKDAGLVSERAAGTRRIYRLNPVAVAALRDQLDTFWQRALAGYSGHGTDAPIRPDRGEAMTQTDAGVVRKHVVVEAPIERAFAVFTERFGDFKPPEHNLLGAPIAETRVRATGRREHRRPCGRRQRVPLGPDPGLRTAGPGRVQLGHQPAVAASRPTRT